MPGDILNDLENRARHTEPEKNSDQDEHSAKNEQIADLSTSDRACVRVRLATDVDENSRVHEG